MDSHPLTPPMKTDSPVKMYSKMKNITQKLFNEQTAWKRHVLMVCFAILFFHAGFSALNERGMFSFPVKVHRTGSSLSLCPEVELPQLVATGENLLTVNVTRSSYGILITSKLHLNGQCHNVLTIEKDGTSHFEFPLDKDQRHLSLAVTTEHVSTDRVLLKISRPATLYVLSTKIDVYHIPKREGHCPACLWKTIMTFNDIPVCG